MAVAAAPNYQLLYQLNPGLFSNNQSLADALYGQQDLDSPFLRYRGLNGVEGLKSVYQAQKDPGAAFPQAQQFFAGMQGGGAAAGGAQTPAPFVPQRAPVLDPNNLPAPIFRYK